MTDSDILKRSKYKTQKGVYMREITQEEINEKVKAHKLWLDSKEKQGERAVFADVSITNKNFFRRNLRRAAFRNIKCVDTNFENADLVETFFENVYFDHVNFNSTIMNYSSFIQCNISDSNFTFANLKDVDFTCTTLDNVNFTYSNLYSVIFSSTNIKKIWVVQAVPINIIGQKVICTQVNTSRENNLISYWADLDIWTTGCFQGTLEELKKAVEETHKNNLFLKNRYFKIIDFILNIAEEDKKKG